MDNVKRITLMKCLGAFNFSAAVFVPFLLSVGIESKGSVFLLEAVFMAAWGASSFVMGKASHRMSCTAIIRIGCVLLFSGFALYAISTNIGMCLAAEIILGMGVACHVGPMDALTTDTLQSQGKWATRRKVGLRQSALYQFGAALSSVAGGTMAQFSTEINAWMNLHLQNLFGTAVENAGMRLIIVATLVPLSMAFCLTLGMKDPPRKRGNVSTSIRKTMMDLASCPARMALVILGAGLFTLLVCGVWCMQLFQQQRGFSMMAMGGWNAGTMLLCGLAMFWVESMEHQDDEQKSISDISLLAGIALAVTFSLGLAAIIAQDWVVVCFLIVRVAVSMSMPVTGELITRFTTKENRVTVIGVQGSVQRFLFAGIGWPIMLALEIHELSTVLLGMALTAAAILSFALALLATSWTRIPPKHHDPDEEKEIPPALPDTMLVLEATH